MAHGSPLLLSTGQVGSTPSPAPWSWLGLQRPPTADLTLGSSPARQGPAHLAEPGPSGRGVALHLQASSQAVLLCRGCSGGAGVGASEHSQTLVTTRHCLSGPRPLPPTGRVHMRTADERPPWDQDRGSLSAEWDPHPHCWNQDSAVRTTPSHPREAQQGPHVPRVLMGGGDPAGPVCHLLVLGPGALPWTSPTSSGEVIFFAE